MLRAAVIVPSALFRSTEEHERQTEHVLYAWKYNAPELVVFLLERYAAGMVANTTLHDDFGEMNLCEV